MLNFRPDFGRKKAARCIKTELGWVGTTASVGESGFGKTQCRAANYFGRARSARTGRRPAREARFKARSAGLGRRPAREARFEGAKRPYGAEGLRAKRLGWREAPLRAEGPRAKRASRREAPASKGAKRRVGPEGPKSRKSTTEYFRTNHFKKTLC